ncbi:MAG TPA: anti-sigma factor, partial [bacterium]
MKCDFPHELLSGYLDGELDGKNKALVEDHLKSCSSCQQFLEALKKQDSLVRSREIEEPSREFVFSLNRRVMDQVMKKPRFSFWRYMPVLVPTAVAALVLVVVFNSQHETRYVTTDDQILLPVVSRLGYSDESGLKAGSDRSVAADKKVAAAKKEKAA